MGTVGQCEGVLAFALTRRRWRFSAPLPRFESCSCFPAGALAAWPRSSSPEAFPGRGACRALAFPGSRWRIGAAGAPLSVLQGSWQRPYTAPLRDRDLFFPPCRNSGRFLRLSSVYTPIFTEVPINFKNNDVLILVIYACGSVSFDGSTFDRAAATTVAPVSIERQSQQYQGNAHNRLPRRIP